MRINKTKVNQSVQAISNDYSVEYSEDIEYVIGEDLEKAINDELLNQIAGPALIEKGWTLVVVKNWERIPQEWIDANLSGKHSYNCFGYYWYFEKETDAIIFRLRWG